MLFVWLVPYAEASARLHYMKYPIVIILLMWPRWNPNTNRVFAVKQRGEKKGTRKRITVGKSHMRFTYWPNGFTAKQPISQLCRFVRKQISAFLCFFCALFSPSHMCGYKQHISISFFLISSNQRWKAWKQHKTKNELSKTNAGPHIETCLLLANLFRSSHQSIKHIRIYAQVHCT